ncbi:MAG: hypothetical protein HN366_05855 [Deltaproteobacteria bacterium]|nr:hypothetical protein [Deltaproteobacteria bacterium]
MNKIISVLLVGLLGFLGCSGSDTETSAVGFQEGDLETETFIIDGQKTTFTSRVYNLAEPDEEPVLILLPLDSADRILGVTKAFMDQTSTRAWVIKAFGDKYYMSVSELVRLATGTSSQEGSEIDEISYDNLNELDELLNTIQQLFGPTAVSELHIMLEEIGLSLKEFDSINKDVLGEDYADRILQEYTTLDNLYSDFLSSEEELYQEFISIVARTESDVKSVIIGRMGVSVTQWMYDLWNLGPINDYNLWICAIGIAHPENVKAVERCCRAHRRITTLVNNLSQKGGQVERVFHFGYDATGIHYRFNAEYVFRGQHSVYPGRYWIPKLKLSNNGVLTTKLCPLYAYYLPKVTVTYRRPVDISPQTDNPVPSMTFRVDVTCYMKSGFFCTSKFWKNNYFEFKLTGKDGMQLVSTGRK